MLPNELREAVEHLRAGRKEAARTILARFVMQQPNSAEAWHLLSLTLSDPRQQADCLRRCLRLQPDNEAARAHLEKLESTLKPSSPAPAAAQPAPHLRDSAAPQSADDGPLPAAVATPAPTPSRPAKPAPPAGAAEHPSGEMPRVPPFRGTRAALQAELASTDGYPSPTEMAIETLERERQEEEHLHKGSSVRKQRWRTCLVILLVVLGLAALAGLVGVAVAFVRANQPPPAVSLQQVGGGATLPPTWTPTRTATVTLTPTETLVPSATPTQTPIPPNPTVVAKMDQIEIEVADIRGLDPKQTVSRYVISRSAVRPILEASFRASGGTQEELDDEARALSALGLIKPTYNLYTNALNGLTDSLGGFFFPWSHELFVIGTSFNGIEHWIYSHEYAHALVDQHHSVADAGVYPVCLENLDRCEAVRAVVEGDASLVMAQWLQQYATPQDVKDILAYNPPLTILPEQFPPPYLVANSQFPYAQGLAFIRYLHNRGNWAGVNKVYDRLPASTEQILHPSKYVANEAPVTVEAVPLGERLGAEWRLLSANSLGEWTTYMLLGYGADIEGQVEDSKAQAAAQGWGGDTYQVYYRDDTGESILAAHWVWDTAQDAGEFSRAMQPSLDARFRGARLTRDDGVCYEANGQATCLFTSGRGSLWLLAPDQTILNTLLAAYPNFP